ncbi:hypothetical protein HA402_009450 [Bradysia odoriphaga]|nr:hypothetical protein HA402_009450 [Bradysia odoriphaga]
MFWLLYAIVLSMGFLVEQSEDLKKGTSATTQMISKLIEESERSTLLFLDLNSEILNDFVNLHELSITVSLNDLKTNPNFNNRKIGAVILHLKNFDDFENFYSLIRPETFLYDGHFIIFYDKANVLEIERMFSKFWNAYIYNVNVLVTNPKSKDLLSMFTYMPFANESCNNNHTVLINEFNETTMKWSTNTFFPKKFKQLNRCPIRFGCYQSIPAVIIDTSENGSRKFSGAIVDILLRFSDVLNFTLSFMEIREGMGAIYKNKTSTGLLKKTIGNEVDLICGALQEDRSEALSATRHVFSDKIILVVPPPFLIDPMKKIFLPFTLASWISIGMVALVACCIVKLLKFTPPIIHDYVIGSNVKGSVLNICNIFLGGAQQTLPRGNFPRFLLANFLIFTLIIRTLYQGEIFKLLKRDVRTVQLNTIEDYVEHKFTFYIFQAFVGRLLGTKMIERHKVVNSSEGRKYVTMTLDPSFKGVLFDHLGCKYCDILEILTV